MAKRKLTHSFIANFDPPESRTEIFDEVTDGLTLRVTPTGYKSFVFRYGTEGKRYTIGSFPTIGLADARNVVKDLRLKIAKGIDPVEEKKAKKNKVKPKTFEDLAETFKKRHLPTLRDSTSEEYERIIDHELKPVLNGIPADQLTRKEIIDLLDSIAVERGKKTLSNRVRAVLSSMYSFGMSRAIVEANPVLSVPKRKKSETKRKRIYSEDEIKALWEAFENQAEPVQTVFKVLLLCGQRSGETKRMKWDHIEDNIWTIPASETKAKRTHHLPLTDSVIGLLENIEPLTGCSDFVFESPTNKGEHIEWLQKAVERMREESGVSDFRIHDLRRTAASYMAKLGTDRTVLGKILNHKGLAGDDQVTAIYDRHDYMEEKEEALNRWSHHLNQILEGKKEAKIHKLGS